MDVDPELIWETYLENIPKEHNPIFRQRRHYDGSYDRHFVKTLGNITSIENGEIKHLWQIGDVGYFNNSVEKIDRMLKNSKIKEPFSAKTSICGSKPSVDNYDKNITWTHFYAKIPSRFTNIFGRDIGESNTIAEVFERSLMEANIEDIDLILENIGQIYRMNEFEEMLKSWKNDIIAYNNSKNKDLFIWSEVLSSRKYSLKYRNTIVRFMLTKDKEISPEEFAEIQTFAQFSYGKNLALYHLSFKARTEKEVRDYLSKHEIDENIIPKVIQSLKDDNWINDRQYAYAIINSNQLSGDKGSYMLIQKISQKGVAKSIIQEVLQEFDMAEVAERTAEKLLKKYQGKLPARALQDKIIQNLTNKGFSYSEAKTAFDQLDNQVDEETVQELIFKELDKQYGKYSRKYEGYELKQRLTQVLARKGYDFSVRALKDKW